MPAAGSSWSSSLVVRSPSRYVSSAAPRRPRRAAPDRGHRRLASRGSPRRRPPLGEDARQRALGSSEATAEPLNNPEVPAHVGIHQPLVLAQVSEGRLIGGHGGVGITPQTSEVGTQEGDRSGDVGQNTQALVDRWLMRLVADGCERALGSCQQRVELLGVALDRGLDGSSQAQAWPRAQCFLGQDG